MKDPACRGQARERKRSRAVSPWVGFPPGVILVEGGASEKGVRGKNQGGGNSDVTTARRDYIPRPDTRRKATWSGWGLGGTRREAHRQRAGNKKHVQVPWRASCLGGNGWHSARPTVPVDLARAGGMGRPA